MKPAAELRYPIGPFVLITPATEEIRRSAVEDIAALPGRLRAAAAHLSTAQLDTPYRPGGWTVRQVVHHLPDSHMNAYIRMKLALTEDSPTITPYREDAWAKLADARIPVEVSLALIDSLHARWASLLRSLGPLDWARTFKHPEYPEGPRTIDWLVQHYAWHGNHHVAHITSLRRREGW